MIISRGYNLEVHVLEFSAVAGYIVITSASARSLVSEWAVPSHSTEAALYGGPPRTCGKFSAVSCIVRLYNNYR